MPAFIWIGMQRVYISEQNIVYHDNKTGDKLCEEIPTEILSIQNVKFSEQVNLIHCHQNVNVNITFLCQFVEIYLDSFQWFNRKLHFETRSLSRLGKFNLM